jgi:hypothetical protein
VVTFPSVIVACMVLLTVDSQWWQQYHRIAFISHGRLVADSVLGLKNPTQVRLTIVCVAFALSGAMHGLSAIIQCPACGFWPPMKWFLLMGAACIAEECLLMWWNTSRLRAMVPGHAQGAMGRIWVYMFFWWSLPKRIFPSIGCSLLH